MKGQRGIRGIALAPRPVRFTPREDIRYTLDRGLGGPRAGVDGYGKSHPQPGFDPRTIQPITGCYTNYTKMMTNANISAGRYA
jgi:hypothetical protein